MNSGSGLGDYNLDLSGPITSVKKEAIKQQIKQELAMANAQELINNINKNCFKMCVPSPGTSLSSSEEVSLNRCIDKYLASWDIVSQAYVSRIQREKH
ncbi:protein translocase subunit [Coemansia spiralis]|uniref:Mitochondrial import inner membrane translocase subunit n=2 Tax=Coemansia TaxID=4863 RepID=A0A9W8GBG6_9FUNG|nr:protein translocase subunit [Coemansia umbellata]KAJ2679897.1 protein translocase subunit [Coemansia spiralis]